uniref:Dynein light chain n=1 Tax=Megaselia scalaris TaxID=36166 RepID=T1GHC7_MEGSC
MEIATNVVNSNQEDKDETPQSYQMRPKLQEMFKTSKIKDLVSNILSSTLKGKTYSSTEAATWTKSIADEVNQALKDLLMHRYKHVVQVVIGQQIGSGYKYAALCRWDAECDSQTSEVFSNASLFCVCTVFGVYLY